MVVGLIDKDWMCPSWIFDNVAQMRSEAVWRRLLADMQVRKIGPSSSVDVTFVGIAAKRLAYRCSYSEYHWKSYDVVHADLVGHGACTEFYGAYERDNCACVREWFWYRAHDQYRYLGECGLWDWLGITRMTTEHQFVIWPGRRSNIKGGHCLLLKEREWKASGFATIVFKKFSVFIKGEWAEQRCSCLWLISVSHSWLSSMILTLWYQGHAARLIWCCGHSTGLLRSYSETLWTFKSISYQVPSLWVQAYAGVFGRSAILL